MAAKPANRGPATKPGGAKPPRNNNKPVNAWAVGANKNAAVNRNNNNRMNTQRPVPKQQQKPNNQANRKMVGKPQANRRP
jgi:hypothetical protein